MKKLISDEEIRWTLSVNGNKAQKELFDLDVATRKLNIRQKELRSERKKLSEQGKKDSAEYKKLTAEINKNSLTISENKKRMEVLRKEIGVSGLSMRQLNNRARQLRAILHNLLPGTKDYKEYRNELKKVQLRINELKEKSRATKLSLSSVANGFNKYAALGASAIAVGTGMVLSLQKMIDYNGKLSDAQADVQKTTGLNKKEVDELTKSFGLLQTRTSRIDLLKIAEEGGRIGIAKEELQDFVRVMNKANVALGDSFDGGVKEVASKLGKLKLLFKETKDIEVDKAYEAIGSAINELGANGVATEPNIASFATRVGSLPENLKPAIQDALGLGAAFEESGLQAEISGRAYAIFLGQAAKETEKFAKVMGISNQEVKDLINEDPVEFFLQFSKRLNDTSKGGVDTAKTLSDLGLSADGVKKIVGAAGSNVDRFRSLLDLSNKSMVSATSLTNEYNIKNNNLAANLDKVRKKLLGAFSSETITKGLESLVGWMTKIIAPAKKVSEEMENKRIELFLLESKVKDVNTKESERLKLIEEFKSKYPGHLANLSADKISNQQLSKAIREVNDELINKIILQQKDEEIEEQNKQIAEKKIALFEQETKVRKLLAEQADKHGIALKENANLEEQSLDLLKKAGPQDGGRLINSTVEFSHQLAVLQRIQKSLNFENGKGNKLLQERAALKKRLGIIDKDTEKPDPDDTTITPPPTTTITSKNNDNDDGDGLTPEDQKILDSKKKLAEFIEQWENDQETKKAITDAQKEALEIQRKEEEIEKKILDAEGDVALTTELEDIKEAEVQAIKDKWAQIRLEKREEENQKHIALDKAQKKALLKADEDLEAAKRNILSSGVGFLGAIVGQKSGIFKALFALEKAVAVNDIIVNTSKANAQIISNLTIANAKAIATSPLTGGMPFVGINTALAGKQKLINNLNAAAQIGSIVATAIPTLTGSGFEEGLYPFIREQDNKLFNARFGGATASGMVNKPTMFLAGENGPELIVDSKAFRKMNPDIKYSFQREIARVKGFEQGYYPQQNTTSVLSTSKEVTQNDTDVSNNDTLIGLLEKNAQLLEAIEKNGFKAIIDSDLRNMKLIQKGLDDYNYLVKENTLK